MREGSFEQLRAMGDLVKRCINIVSEDRPTMKEVVIELEGIRRNTKHPWAQEENDGESEAVLAEQSDLYAIDVGQDQFSTGTFPVQDSLENPMTSPNPR